MTRKKVQLAWIVNDNARKNSLKKKRSGLVKKVSELLTLCDVDAALIVYSPNETEAPMTWPSDQSEVQRVVGKFLEAPSMDRERKKVDHESYLLESDAKVQEQLRKFQTRYKEAQVNYLMHQINQGHIRLDQLSVAEMDGVLWFMEDKMKMIRRGMEISQPLTFQPQPEAAAVASETDPIGDVHFPLPPPPQGSVDDGASSVAGLGVGGDRSAEGTNFTNPLLHGEWFSIYNNGWN